MPDEFHEFHEFASMFPMLEGKELDELVADIKANGQREMIVMLDGKVLDGRNRYIACHKLGIKPRMRDFQCIDGDPMAFVWSANVARRHLTVNQRAIAMAKRTAFLRRGNVQAQRSGPPNGGPQLSNAQAAEIAQVPVRTLERAKAVLKYGTKEDIEAIEQGDKLWPIHKATMERVEPEVKQANNPVGRKGRGGWSKMKIPANHTPESYARYGLKLEQEDAAPSLYELARKLCIAGDTYAKMREIIMIYDMENLSPPDRAAADEALLTMNRDYQVVNAYPLVEPIADRLWGNKRGSYRNPKVLEKRVSEFEKQIEIIKHVCEADLDVPQLNPDQVEYTIEALNAAATGIKGLIKKVKEIYNV